MREILRKYRWLIIAILLLSILDITTTYHVVCNRGGIEINRYYTQMIYSYGFLPSAFTAFAVNLSLFLIFAFLLEKFTAKILPNWAIISVLFITFLSGLILANIFNFHNIFASRNLEALVPLLVHEPVTYEYVVQFDHQRFCRLINI